MNEVFMPQDHSHTSNRASPVASVTPKPTGRTFADAVASHVENGGEPRYLGRIVAYFDDRTLSEIYPFDIKEMAKAFYPERSNATLNRQALAPARAVMIHAHERGWCGYTRLRRFREDTPKRREPASPKWLHTFTRQCMQDGHARLAALVLFMATSGARVTEAINLRWGEVDLRQRNALLLKTKTDRNSLCTLTGEVAERLMELQKDRQARRPRLRLRAPSVGQCAHTQGLRSRRHYLQAEPYLWPPQLHEQCTGHGARHPKRDAHRRMAQPSYLPRHLRSPAPQCLPDRCGALRPLRISDGYLTWQRPSLSNYPK